MKSEFSNGVMTICLAGRIDTSNSAAVEKEINEILSSAGTIEKLQFDAAELEYISSSGLRIMLKCKKQIADLEIINASNTVYDIFEVTGFASIMTVKKALRKLDLSKCELLAQGGNGAVYRVNDEEIIKVQHLAETEQMMLDEMRRAKAAFVLGVPTAISYDIVDCGEGRKGAIYEALNSTTFGNYVHTNPEKLAESAVRYADLLDTLHSTEADAASFGRMKDIYLGYYEESLKNGYLTAEEIEICKSLLDFIPDANTLVHGDAHTNNILMNGEKGAEEPMFIDMADTALGHFIFDIAGIGLAMLGSQRNERCLGICGMASTEINQFLSVAFAHACCITDAEEIKQILPRVARISFIKHSMIVGMSTKDINAMRDLLVAHIRANFFPNIEQIKQDIQWFIEHYRK